MRAHTNNTSSKLQLGGKKKNKPFVAQLLLSSLVLPQSFQAIFCTVPATYVVHPPLGPSLEIAACWCPPASLFWPEHLSVLDAARESSPEMQQEQCSVYSRLLNI